MDTPPKPQAKRSLGARAFAYSLVVVLVILGIVEGAARALYDDDDLNAGHELHLFIDHPTWFWTYKPNLDIIRDSGVRFQTNSLGIRHTGEIEVPAPEGVFRILSLGESSSVGHTLEANQTYAAVFQDRLNAGAPDGVRFEVINAAREAWTVWQSAIYLEEAGIDLDPDMVLVYHQTNDLMPTNVIDAQSFLYRLDGTDRQRYERRRKVAPLLGILYHFKAYRVLRHALMMRGSADLPQMTHEYLDRAGRLQRVPTEDRREALRRMKATCEAHDALLVVLEPFYESRFLDDKVLEPFAQEYGVPFVSIFHWMNFQVSGPPSVLFTGDRIHPNAAGHEAIADALTRALTPIIQGRLPAQAAEGGAR